MVTLIVLGIALTVVILFGAVLTRNAPRRENRFADSGELVGMPWIDTSSGSGESGGSSDCDAASSSDSDSACGDSGGGGGDGGGGGGGD